MDKFITTLFQIQYSLRVLSCLLPLFSTALAWAQEDGPEPDPLFWEAGYEAGPFKLYPAAKLRGMYDSNIFLERKDRDSDFIELLTGALEMGVEEEHVKLDVSYEATQWWHHHNEQANRLEQFGDLDFRWEILEGGVVPYLRLGGNFSKAAQPVDSDTISRVEIQQWTTAFRIGVQADATTVEVEYSFLDLATDVSAIEFFEHQQWMSSLRVMYEVTARLNAMAEGSVGETDFENGIKKDNGIRQYRAGIAWQVIEEIIVGAHLGYQSRDYRRTSGLFGPGNDDFSGLVYDISLRWTPDDQNKVLVLFSKDVQESILSNFARRHTLMASYTHLFGEDLSWSLGGSGDWGHEATDVSQRVKQRYSAQTSLRYQIAVPLAFEGSLLYRTKNTNDDMGDYSDWQATVGLMWAFGRPIWAEFE